MAACQLHSPIALLPQVAHADTDFLDVDHLQVPAPTGSALMCRWLQNWCNLPKYGARADNFFNLQYQHSAVSCRHVAVFVQSIAPMAGGYSYGANDAGQPVSCVSLSLPAAL